MLENRRQKSRAVFIIKRAGLNVTKFWRIFERITERTSEENAPLDSLRLELTYESYGN
jgi:hypothetical protein